MLTFTPTKEEIDAMGGIIGYPEAGRYVLMIKDGKILGGEIERDGEFQRQISALPKYYPVDAVRFIAELDEKGTFTPSASSL